MSEEVVCAGCGKPAGTWKQCPGLNPGIGVCRECAYGAIGDAGRMLRSAVEWRKTIGVPGVHFAPEYVTVNGRRYVLLASFPDNGEGCTEANEYMAMFDGASVLTVTGGRIFIADANDKGIPIEKTNEGGNAL